MLEQFDALLLARMQFAFTVSFHFVFPAISIGLASYLAVLEGLWLWTGREVFLLTTYRFRPEVVDGGRLGMVEARSWTERVLGWVGSSMRPGASAGCWASGCLGNAR